MHAVAWPRSAGRSRRSRGRALEHARVPADPAGEGEVADPRAREPRRHVLRRGCRRAGGRRRARAPPRPRRARCRGRATPPRGSSSRRPSRISACRRSASAASDRPTSLKPMCRTPAASAVATCTAGVGHGPVVAGQHEDEVEPRHGSRPPGHQKGPRARTPMSTLRSPYLGRYHSSAADGICLVCTGPLRLGQKLGASRAEPWGGSMPIASGRARMTGFTPAPWPRRLRSQSWYAGTSKDNIYHRSWMKNQGLPADLFDGRPVIGICNTWSQLTPCNAHLRDLAERVKHGVYEAGGLPLEFPVFSPGESSLRPTAMMYRNLCAMDVEEAMRGQPDRRRGAAGRLRQDHAGAADGRGQRRHPGDRRLRRADAERLVPRRAGRVGHRALADVRGGEGRDDEPRRLPRGRGGDEPLARAPATPWAPPRRWRAWPRRSAWRCRATPRSRRSTRAAG